MKSVKIMLIIVISIIMLSLNSCVVLPYDTEYVYARPVAPTTIIITRPAYYQPYRIYPPCRYYGGYHSYYGPRHR